MSQVDCPDCGGAGGLFISRCERCGGSGKVEFKAPKIEVYFPNAEGALFGDLIVTRIQFTPVPYCISRNHTHISIMPLHGLDDDGNPIGDDDVES